MQSVLANETPAEAETPEEVLDAKEERRPHDAGWDAVTPPL